MVLLTALFFYGVLPLVGAWRVRRRWMLFRQDVLAALGAPEVDFPLLQTGHVVPSGRHRLTGALEAFEGSDRLWIGNDLVSVAVSLVHTPVYFLDSPEAGEVAGEPPRRVEAPSLGALLEGTQFLVSGDLVADQSGQLHFASQPGSGRLLILAFEGDPSTVLRRALLAGRPVIDHWNAWTPVSVGLGITVLLVLAWLQWGTLGGTGPLALALAFVPSTFFLPPGIAFFYGFGRLWARGRRLRAEADLRRTGPQPEPGQPRTKGFRTKALVWESVAHAFLTAGIIGNTLLLVWLVNLWLP